jgi:pyridoxamine 5'-phosphate oxidase
MRMAGWFDQSGVAAHASGGGARWRGATGELLSEPLEAEPFGVLAAWYAEAQARGDTPNPGAMTLATVDERGRPAARIVLCKALEGAPGSVVFYTNYSGRKGRELAAKPEAALVFHWDAMDRQARVEGPVTRVSEAESDAYFASRPWESRIGAWASDQSEPVASRRALLERVRATMRRFGIDPDRPGEAGPGAQIPRPAHWGGYRVHARRVELWVSGAGRVHDRAEWTRELRRDGGGFVPGPWSATRLQP